MKNIYKIALAILLALPLVTSAQTAPTSWTRNVSGGFVFPNILTDFIRVSRIVATSTTATSTFANGIDLSGGCFAIAGTCLGGGSSQWTTTGSDVYYNTGNVGIGTTTPISKLTIQKTITSDVDFPALALSRDDTANTTGDSLGDIDFWSNDASNDGPGIGSRIRGVVDDTAGRSYGLSLWTRSGGLGTPISEKMRITSAGNVGIGTTTPASILHLDSGSASLPSISLSASGGSLQAIGRASASFIGAGTTDLGIRYSNKLWLGNTGTASAVLDSSGNFGIGTTSPAGNLEVLGSTGIYSRNSSGGRIVFDDSDVASASTPMSYITGADGSLQFGRANRAASGLTTGSAESLRITSTGNVGIGTTSPYMNLSVVGRTKLGYHTLCGDSQPLASSTGSVLLECWGNSAYNVEMGVGNRSNANTAYTDIFLNNDLADSSITHYGSIYLNSSTYNDATYGTGQAFPNQMGIQNTDGLLSLFSSTSTASRNGINFYVGGTNTTNEIARITTAGLGVGSSTPYAKLSVTNTGTAPTVLFEDSASPDTTPFIIDATGNVGIGTTSPLAKLNVYSAGSGVGTANTAGDDLVVENSNAGGISILTPNANSSFLMFGSPADNFGAGAYWNSNNDLFTILTANTGADISFQTGDQVEAMRIFDSGNIAIGTSTPASASAVRLTSVSSQGGGIQLADTDGGGAVLTGLGGDAVLYTYAGLVGSEAYSERLRVLGTNGNVGIGTTTPNDILTVYGGGVSINPGGASRPTCTANNRGDIWNTFGGAGVADTFAVCQKDAADAYSWVTK